MTPLLRSAARRASRKDLGLSTPNAISRGSGPTVGWITPPKGRVFRREPSALLRNPTPLWEMAWPRRQRVVMYYTASPTGRLNRAEALRGRVGPERGTRRRLQGGTTMRRRLGAE